MLKHASRLPHTPDDDVLCFAQLQMYYSKLIQFYLLREDEKRSENCERSGDRIFHYSVANMPGAVPITSTMPVTNATLPYALHIADKGWKAACKKTRASKTA